MKPAIINIVLYQGSTFRKSFQWLSGSNPTDLTNCIIRMQIKQDHFGPVVQEFSTATIIQFVKSVGLLPDSH